MECGNVFIEVHGEKVESSLARGQSILIVLENVVKVVGGLCGNWANLLVTTCISRDEENGNALDLVVVSFVS